MTVLNLTPSQQDIASFGTLAYVLPEERAKVMKLSARESRAYIKRLGEEIKKAERDEVEQVKREENRIRAMPAGAPRREMTSLERDWVNQLQRVRFPSQSKDPGFVHAMASHPMITERQAAYIKAIVFKYRRQL